MNETIEPDLIEKGFRNFGKLNKSITSSIDQANKAVSEQMKEAASSPAIQEAVGSHGYMFLIMFIFIVFMILTSNYTMSMNYDTKWLSIPIILLLAYGLYNFVNPMPVTNNWISPWVSRIMLIAFSGLLVYYYVQFSQQTTSTISYLYSFLSILMIFVSLAIVFYFLGEYIKRLEGLPGLVTQFLFYLPCLILQFVSYIKKEFNDTTSPVFYLFVIELLLILLYIYLPKITKELLMKKGINLLPDTLFLDEPHVLTGSEVLKMEQVDKLNQTSVFRKNYAITFWLYLNDQGSNYKAYAKESNIFNYADGAPHIVYENNLNDYHGRNNLVIYYTNRDRKQRDKIRLRITKQKWHHIVINYNHDYMDVFINGKLSKSVPLDNLQRVYSPYDNIMVGDKDGLDGAICNVTYYTVPLSKRNIMNEYNLLAYKNPPVETKWIPKELMNWNMLKNLFFLRTT